MNNQFRYTHHHHYQHTVQAKGKTPVRLTEPKSRQCAASALVNLGLLGSEMSVGKILMTYL